jgi:prephenate dehydrogenase
MKPTVAIVGLGLIGGSLGLALRRTGRYRVLGISRRPSTLRDALKLGAADQVSKRFEDVAQADIVVLAMPIASIVPSLKRLLPFLKPNALVTDVGSVKGALLKAIEPLLRDRSVSFVGGHPLAGSHKTGVRAARKDLFKGAVCVLVPLNKANTRPLQTLWRSVGARPLIMTAAAHDTAVALTSHLPHVLAHSLVHAARRRSSQPQLKALMAGSFRDVTRVASADPEQWAEIFAANTPALRQAIAEFRRELKVLSAQIGRSSLRPHLRRSQDYRRPLFHGI